jgi:hypothetical protein
MDLRIRGSILYKDSRISIVNVFGLKCGIQDFIYIYKKMSTGTGTGTHDTQQKSVVIFIIVILLLFFASNDKKLNKIFHKNMIQILFLGALIYMHYLKINVILIFALFLLFLLFHTDIGKKLQKNRYIKRIIKRVVPYINPIRFAIEDFVESFTNPGPDDESSIGSSIYKKRVRFEDDGDGDGEGEGDGEGDGEEGDDLEFEDEEDMSEMAVENGYDFEKPRGKSNKEMDILDEIRNDMKMENLNGRPTGVQGKTQAKKKQGRGRSNSADMSETPLDQIMNMDDGDGDDGDGGDPEEDEPMGEDEPVPDATLDPGQVRELFKEYSSLKREMEEYN